MLDKVIPDKAITLSLNGIFSKWSLVVHTVWFVVWFLLHLDVSLLTNIVSLEAIYVGILIGIQQIHHHKSVNNHLEQIKSSGKK